MTPNHSDYKRMREQMPVGSSVVVRPNITYPTLAGLVGRVAVLGETTAGVDFQCKHAGGCYFHNLEGRLPGPTGWYLPLEALSPNEEEGFGTISSESLDSLFA